MKIWTLVLDRLQRGEETYEIVNKRSITTFPSSACLATTFDSSCSS